MAGPKYPLDPLRRVRKDQVDDAARALAEAVGSRERASARRAGAEDEEGAERARAEAVRQDEQAALEAGALRVADLAQAATWEVAARLEAERLAARVATARAEETHALGEEHGARGELASRQADADVVEKDRERFLAKERRAAEAKEQEAAEEAHRPKGRGA